VSHFDPVLMWFHCSKSFRIHGKNLHYWLEGTPHIKKRVFLGVGNEKRRTLEVSVVALRIDGIVTDDCLLQTGDITD